MAGMLRIKDEAELAALLKRSNGRIRDTFQRRAQNGQKEVSNPARSATRANLPVRTGSDLEELLAGQIRTVGNLPEPVRDQPYLIGRAHRLDFAWPDWTVNGWKIGLEVQGMAHRIKGKFLADIEKRVLSQQQGWLILEVAGDHVRSGKAMEWLQDLFKRAEKAK